jgi:hypothetical protein
LIGHRRGTRLDPAVVIAGCLLFVVVLFLPLILSDNDTLWQIRTGGWILDHRAIPSTDPFSFTAGDRRWFAHEWLAETLMALAFRAGGMQGVMALAAAAAGVTGAMLLHHARRFLPGFYAIAAVILGLSCAASSLLARPHLLVWPCLMLWCGGLVTARAQRRAPSFALLPVMLVWVNMHGSFMLGLLLSGAFMIEALFDHGADRRRVFRSWCGFILAAWAVALINPDFLAGVLFPYHLIGMTNLVWINEWRPADFSRFQSLELVILVALRIGFSGKMVLPPVRLILLLGLIHFALAHGRYEQVLGIVGVLVLAEPLGASLARGGARASDRRWRYLSAGMTMVAVVALAARIALPLSPERTGAAFSATLDAVPPSLRAQPVLNEYGLGGQLIFAGVRPFIDGRADLYGGTFLGQYVVGITSGDHSALDRALSEYGIAWTVFPAGHAMIAVMDEKPGWRRLVDRNHTIIHVREDWLPR